MSDRQLCVYFVDDNVESLQPLAAAIQSAGVATCDVLHPADIEKQHLANADLIIVDHTLDAWPGRDQLDEISLKPINGVALVSVLREYARSLHGAPPTGFALITGRPDAVTIVPARRPHVLSRLSNLEWFFEKGLAGNADVMATARKIASLAAAVAGLPQDVRTELSPVTKLVEYLDVPPSRPLFERYCEAVQRCRPPIHLLSEWSHGLAVVRWLLHQILPHAAFLFDRLDLALRLGVTPRWLDNQLAAGRGLGADLEKFRYTGPLHDFDGPRSWRDGIEQWLWDGTNGDSADAKSVMCLVQSRSRKQAEVINLRHPVIALTRDLKRDDRFVELADVFRLQLDDWPGYADPPYMRRTDVGADETLRASVAE